ncbi:MAG: DUF2141 domain-containing protein [Rhodospirillales bacterium]|nr:DUF2141 domain-containing protein [Rhodospirillales bacterium]
MIGPTPNSRRRFAFAFAVAVLSAPAAALATDLRVTITGLDSDAGNVHVSVYDNPETFPKSTGMLREQVVKAQAPMPEVTFPGLAPGTYAVAAFHDENGNRKFDQGFLGLPLEDYGFSNDPMVILSAPDFQESAFTISGDVAVITVRMKR